MKRQNYQWVFRDKNWRNSDEDEIENKEFRVDLQNAHGEHLLYVEGKEIGKINKGKTDLMNYEYKFEVEGHKCTICNSPSINEWRLLFSSNVELYVDGYPCNATSNDYASTPFPGIVRKDYFGLLFLIVGILAFFANIAFYAIMVYKTLDINILSFSFVFLSLECTRELFALYRRPIYERKVTPTGSKEGSVQSVLYWFLQLLFAGLSVGSTYLMFIKMVKIL